MNLHQQILTARLQKGLTQEELAAQCGVTARTVQRIESGKTIPRSFTLKAIAGALQIPFEHLVIEEKQEPQGNASTLVNMTDSEVDFLKLLTLSCFSYLIIPYLHFLVPLYILKREAVTNALVLRQARSIITTQIFWVVGCTLLLLMVLAVNLYLAAHHHQYHISYVAAFFVAYMINACIIGYTYIKVLRYNALNVA